MRATRLAAVAFALLAPACAGGPGGTNERSDDVPADVHPDALVIANATLIDGSEGPPIELASIVIRGNRIAWLGPADRLSVAGNARVYDASGQYAIHEELALLVEAGLSPAEAIRAATSEAARYLDMTDSLGTITTGKLADLVLLDANPLEDIRNTTRIRAVVRDGRLHDRADLDRLLEEMPQ